MIYAQIRFICITQTDLVLLLHLLNTFKLEIGLYL